MESRKTPVPPAAANSKPRPKPAGSPPPGATAIVPVEPAATENVESTPKSGMVYEKSRKRLAPKHLLTASADSTAEVFSVRFSPDAAYVAAGCSDGSIRVYNVSTGRQAYALSAGTIGLPTTCIRWRPQVAASKTKNVLISVSSEGLVQHWHITSGKCLHTIVDNEDGNQLYCLDYNPEGTFFATAGKDRKIKVYDEATKALATTLEGGGMNSAGHSNRVFSLRFHPDDPNTILTGGWDNTIQIWDIRVGHSVRSIYGPHICGDSVDIHRNVLLSGSWRNEDQLQLWDFGSGQLIETIPWRIGPSISDPVMVYGAQFSKSGDMIVAGGSGSNEAKLFDRSKNNIAFGTVTGMSRACYTVDFSDDSKMVAVGGGDGAVRLLDIIH